MNHKKKGGEGISGRRNGESKVLDSGKNVIWGNVKRFRACRNGSSRKKSENFIL